MARVLAGTAEGLHEFDGSGRLIGIAHDGRRVDAIAPEGWELWAIVDGTELWHTAGVDWWFKAAAQATPRLNCVADTRAGVVVGAAEAGLYRVAGEGLERLAGFDQAEGRSEWFTPWGGPPDTRSISEDREAVYVNEHVGGILRSTDHGDSWHSTIDINADVHQVRTRQGHVVAATARGLALSPDQGATWKFNTDGLHATYCRAVAPCGDSLLVSAAKGPRGEEAAVYRGGFGGGPLVRCREGLPESFDGNVDTYWLDALPKGELAAFATPDGQIFASTDQGQSWAELANGLPGVICLLVIP
jgi:photosystem II stability/assembly factor-like uncharacterized protein